MKLLTLELFPRRVSVVAACCVALTFSAWIPAFGQHGGGHAAGGGGHVAAPHVSAPAVSTPHVVITRPAIIGPPAGTRSFVATPPIVHLTPRPGMNRPAVGSHVMMPPVLPPQSGPRTIGVGPHTVIGFPADPREADRVPLHFSPVMSFSGQGRDIWQDSARGVTGHNPSSFAGRIPRGPHTPPFPVGPRFPGRPIFPIFGPPGFGFFGSPFFGLGLGFGFNSIWWPSCGPYWGWGYGCNAMPYYDYAPDYEPGYEGNGLEAQMENQSGPEMYEYPSATSPIFVYGEEGRELVQLYLKDGTVYNVTDYWLVNDQLHCTTVEGASTVEHVFNFGELDLQKTIDVNTARGFKFVLRNEPIEQYLRDHPDAGTNGQAGGGVVAPQQPAAPPARPPEP